MEEGGKVWPRPDSRTACDWTGGGGGGISPIIEAATEAKESVLRWKGNRAGIRPLRRWGALGSGESRSFIAVYILSTSAMPWGKWWLEKDRRRVGDRGDRGLLEVTMSSFLAQLTPSLGGGEDSWKPWFCCKSPGQQQEDPDCWSTLLAGPLGSVPWEKAAFWREWGMWEGERGAEPEYRSVMAVLVEPREEEDRPEEKESLRSRL
jgi:hypothetical protein